MSDYYQGVACSIPIYNGMCIDGTSLLYNGFVPIFIAGDKIKQFMSLEKKIH